jgi:hypothetical protein
MVGRSRYRRIVLGYSLGPGAAMGMVLAGGVALALALAVVPLSGEMPAFF